tara:strand:+ start:52 stop:474 length:423 start_codon:yes stop_codon:yes gene_type:complete
MHSSIKNDTSYKIIKLTSGETIIATLTSDDADAIEVQNPLLMNISPHETEFGEQESLNLCRWIEPYTEQKYFSVTKSTIITTANVSEGLTRYYEYFIKKLENWKEDNIGKESKSYVEEYSKEEIYDEILDILDTESKSIH